MLANTEFVKIGFIRKAHGVYGHVKLIVEDAYIDDLTEAEFVFLNREACFIPYRIEELTENNDLILKLDFFNTPEEIKALTDPSIYLPKNVLRHGLASIEKREKALSLNGYQLYNAEDQLMGLIRRIEEYPQQMMIVFQAPDDREILAPLHDQLILDIDPENKKIRMDLPDGLL